MTQRYTHIKHAFLLSSLALPMLAFAGNIPQYKVEKGGTPYSEISDGTVLKMAFNGNAVMFGDGRMFYDAEKTGKGFPIGFYFRLGGQLFDQFIVDNYGNLYLGRGEVGYGTTAFKIGMAPVSFGLSKADVSYKTEGEEGGRILTVQYKNATLNETTKDKGKYNLQLRLYEADGKIEMAFNELETCYGSAGFGTGLRGWDEDDTLYLAADGLDKPFSISPKKKPYMLDADSYIKWDDDDYDNGYSPCFVFTPDLDTSAPLNAPTDLTLEQDKDVLRISCRRGRDAKATVVLISESPFTDADLPVNGVTFRAGRDEDTGKYHTKIGKSTALYYGNDTVISLEVPGLEAGKSYYVCAISANGFPAYDREGRAEQVLSSSQAAPEAFRITSSAPDAISVYCKADYPVIIATTSEAKEGFDVGYTGVFGTPSADVKIGDELEGGGRVVYVGDPTSVKVEALPNQLIYLRAWTVDGDKVSATYLDGIGIPVPSFPYEPSIENYPLNTSIYRWTAQTDQFLPVKRAYAEDRAVMAVTGEDMEVSLTTPSFTSYRDMTLAFDFAMETEKELAPGEEGQVMLQGYEPGKFGETGYLRISSGDETLKEVKEYNGTMKSVSTGGNEDGSSTFETIEVEVPATGEAQSLTFAFSTSKKSRLFLRNISLAQTGEAPALPANAPANLSASWVEEDGEAKIRVTADKAEDAHGSLILVSEDDFNGTPEDGKQYKAGDEIGNATVLYHGKDGHIETLSPSMDSKKVYVLTALSHNQEGSFAQVASTVRLMTTGVENILTENTDFSNAEIYNVTGIRIKAESLKQIPSGLYIVNGKKVIVCH